MPLDLQTHEALIPTHTYTVCHFSGQVYIRKSQKRFASGRSYSIDDQVMVMHNMCIDPERLACNQPIDIQLKLLNDDVDRHARIQKRIPSMTMKNSRWGL